MGSLTFKLAHMVINRHQASCGIAHQLACTQLELVCWTATLHRVHVAHLYLAAFCV